MNKIAAILFMLFLFSSSGFSAIAQSPVQWQFTSKKTGDNSFEVHLTAIIKPGWHVYAQHQPEDAIAVPTQIRFNKHPLLQFKDGVKENGKLEKIKDETLGIEAWQYAGKVDFVQTVTLKTKVTTSISGTVEFMVCNDEKCLPAKTLPFTIPLQ